MKIQFLGAARSVTGSKHLITTTQGTKILLDCGLFQGRRKESREKNRNLPFTANEIDAVVVGHAHIDHSGNLPNLVRSGYNKTIYTTSPTDELCHYMLPDSAYLQERDIEYINKKNRKKGIPQMDPIYEMSDAMDAIRLIRPHKLNTWFQVAEDVEVMFIEAGHVLGAALTKLRIKEGSYVINLGYIVDLGRKGLPLLNDPEQMRDVDFALIESTYGNRVHENISNAKEELAEIINRTFERGGKIIIPSFALERTQELIYYIAELHTENRIPDIPLFIDSPLAVNLTFVFREFLDWFDRETQELLQNGTDPFDTARIEYVRSVDRSKELNTIKEPMIIISASGMAEAGRVLHHLKNNVEDPKNTIMIVGFMAQNTLGRKFMDGLENVPILGERYTVKAEVFKSNSFSAHADRDELIEYTSRLGPVKKIFTVHGEEAQTLELALALKDLDNLKEVHVPNEGDEVELT